MAERCKSETGGKSLEAMPLPQLQRKVSFLAQIIMCVCFGVFLVSLLHEFLEECCSMAVSTRLVYFRGYLEGEMSVISVTNMSSASGHCLHPVSSQTTTSPQRSVLYICGIGAHSCTRPTHRGHNQVI